jgi:cytidylate kinase
MHVSSLDSLSRYLQIQLAIPVHDRETPQPSITISREAGAGAITIATMLADRLNQLEKRSDELPSWTVFDRNLASQVLIDHKLPLNLEKFIVEDARLPVDAIVEELLGLHPTPWTFVQQTTKTILRLASLGRVILVGRGAEIVTKCLPYVFHVRLVASLEQRVQHAAEYYHLAEPDAARKVKEEDQARRRYLRRYFDADIDNPLLYDLVINTGRLGLPGTAELIAQAAMRHYEGFLKTRQPVHVA